MLILKKKSVYHMSRVVRDLKNREIEVRAKEISTILYIQ